MKHFWNNIKINKFVIKNYDFIVNNLNCKYVWKCDQKNIANMYKKNITSNHIEIGPGTGYFLKNYKFNNLTLIDVNKDILLECENNLKSNCKNINIINKNIFNKNNQIELNNYNSIGLNYVLHCVPNKLSDSLDNLRNNIISDSNLNLFGSTVIPPNNIYNLATLEIYFLNKLKIFNNINHSDSELRKYVKNNFNKFNIIKEGHSLLFDINSFKKK